MKRLMITGLLVASVVVWGAAMAAGQTEPQTERHLLINEIEINPPGVDSDREWVELLNPTDQAIDLLGWRISYSYRSEGYLEIAETSTIIPSGGRYVFVYPGLRLRNGEPHVFRLLDPAGNIVEETAPFFDERDDDKTWQRFPDGGDDPYFHDLWFMRDHTRNKSNS